MPISLTQTFENSVFCLAHGCINSHKGGWCQESSLKMLLRGATGGGVKGWGRGHRDTESWADGWKDGWVLVEFAYIQRSEVACHGIRNREGWLSPGSLHRQCVNVSCLCHGDKQHQTEPFTLHCDPSSLWAHTQDHTHGFNYLLKWIWAARSKQTHEKHIFFFISDSDTTKKKNKYRK